VQTVNIHHHLKDCIHKEELPRQFTASPRVSADRIGEIFSKQTTF